jgi:hypothetical protein
MRRLFQPLNDEVPVRQENGFAVAPHFAWRDRTGPALPLRPLHHRRHRNAEAQSHGSAAFPRPNRCNNPFPQIL